MLDEPSQQVIWGTKLVLEIPLDVQDRPLVVWVTSSGLMMRPKGTRHWLSISWNQVWNRAAILAADPAGRSSPTAKEAAPTMMGKQKRDVVAALLIFIVGGAFAALVALNMVLTFSARWSTWTEDLYFYRLDRWLGYDALGAMAAFQRLGLLRAIAERVYLALPFALAAAVGLVAVGRVPRVLLARLALAPVLGFLLYQIVPACGPVFVPPALFSGPPHPLALDRTVWRNALPSLHFVWALLLLPAWPGPRQVRSVLGFAFVALTALTCLGDGQHYLVDLVAAVPFYVLIVWLTPAKPAENLVNTAWRICRDGKNSAAQPLSRYPARPAPAFAAQPAPGHEPGRLERARSECP